MYPTSYQAGIDPTILDNPYKKLIGLRYSYGYQFDLLKEIKFTGKMVDFGCGAANFLINCNHAGFSCDGVEFNPKHVEVLKEEIPKSNIYTVEDFFRSDEKFDIIRLSNVFEHFTDPKQMMNQLKTKLNSGGYFLIEGPIEMNFNLAKQFRKVYFSLRKRLNNSYVARHTPTHIVFTNKENQLTFFKDLNLEQVHFNISEAEWPFPSSFASASGTIGKINYIIAQISILVSGWNKNFGNTFIYIGKT
ncbi:MAG: 2-polyprenyl-3-methyl-5-hydroxy-6-metoxy-1,4-benzoquinol methylase [Vicingaceae bacterium]|jgi:2-polyprenyl-3-methyl-5-hydroxy-6-metoxy-1,4-benzoquinol methylase